MADTPGADLEWSRPGGHVETALARAGIGTWYWQRDSDALWCDRGLGEAICGLDSSEAPMRLEDMVGRAHPGDAERLRSLLQGSIEDHFDEVECRIRRGDGTEAWMLARGTVLRSDDGDVLGTAGWCLDVTRRRLAEERNQRRADAERAASERLSFLASVNDALNVSLDHDEVLAAVAGTAVPRLGDWCGIWVLSEDRRSVRHSRFAHVDAEKVRLVEDLQERLGYAPDDETGLAGIVNIERPRRVPETAGASAVEDLSDEILAGLAEDLGVTSAVAVPLVAAGERLGAMLFAATDARRDLGEEDLTLAEAVAGRVAAALANLDLYERQRSATAALQRHLLPRSLPEIEGLEVAVRYWAAGEATEVGGDLYDLFEVGPDRWALVVGDVCGTGAEAASLTSATRHTLRAVARQNPDHERVLTALNETLRMEDPDGFVTVLYGTLERSGSGWHLEMASAGHPLPVLVGRDGNATTIGGPGTLLGPLEDLRLRVGRCRLRPGEKLLAYTDGVTDVRPPAGLKPRQLADLAADLMGPCVTADEAADAMGAMLAGIKPIAEREDDIAMVILSAEGPS